MKLTGGQIIAEHLIAEGVPYIVGIPGHGSIALADAFIEKRDRITMLQPRCENGAVYLADGYFRASGKPLAVYTSIGPGAINTAIGVATAYVDSTAVLVMTGDTHTHMMGKGVLQEIERRHDSAFSQILSPVTKRYWRATQADQLPNILWRAFNEMLTGRKGPALISLPMNVQADAADVEMTGPFGRRGVDRMVGDPESVRHAATLLMRAGRPVILAGGGINSSEAWLELEAVAEFVGAAVITTFQGKGCFPEDHELSGWLTGAKGTKCGVHLATRADVMLAVGCRFADETTSSYRPGSALGIPPTKLIHIDIDSGEIGKNYPVEVGIVGDAKATLAALLDCLKAEHKPAEYRSRDYFTEIQDVRKAWYDEIVAWGDDGKDPMMITCLLREIRSFIERDALVVSSSGNTQAQILQEFPFYLPRTNITTAGFSTMGWAFCAAMGAKLARPDKQVLAVLGDGDYMMTMAELATAVQQDIPVVAVVANNIGWHSIRDLQLAAFGEDRAINVEFLDRSGQAYTPNFADAARAFGAHGERITKSSEVRGALERAFASGKPAIIEAMCQRESPYTGSPAVGWWDVPVPTYLTKRRAKYDRERAEEKL
ncbi:MAG: thiamine pyrophosphate-binding protein [Phycisphaerae bacterium]|nr:thiamine pyrophosphate-binding protein [Phycisphaerae bacterium]